MAFCWKVAENIVEVVAVAAGAPFVVMLFLGVLGYCWLEWLRDTVAARLSVPTRNMRTIEANS